MKQKNATVNTDEIEKINIDETGITIGDIIHQRSQDYATNAVSETKYALLIDSPHSNQSICAQIVRSKHLSRVDLAEYARIAPETFKNITQNDIQNAVDGKNPVVLQLLIQHSAAIKQQRLQSVTSNDMRIYLSEKFYMAKQKALHTLLWRPGYLFSH